LTEGDVEVLVLPGTDPPAAEGDLGGGLGDGAVVGLDRRLELGGGGLGGPAVLRGDEDAEDGVVVGRKTCTCVVLAVSSSLGTRKVRTPSVAPLA
jgi:hypothetical protein